MGTPPSDSSRKEVPKKPSLVLHCRICDKPVALETAKSDHAGNAIHEECYALTVKLEHASQDGHAKATRPWMAVATEVSREHDPKRMGELMSELNQAMAEQNLDGTPKRKPHDKPSPDSK